VKVVKDKPRTDGWEDEIPHVGEVKGVSEQEYRILKLVRIPPSEELVGDRKEDEIVEKVGDL
jgi:hypothetical protein